MNWSHFLIAIRWQNVMIIGMMQTIIFFQYVLPFCGREQYEFVSFILLVTATASVLGAGNVFNDLQDTSTDSLHPGKPALVGHEVSMRLATKWVYILNGIAIVAAVLGVWFYSWSILLLFIFIIAIAALVVYSIYLKSTILTGNILIALLCALAVWMITLLLPQCTRDIYADSASRTTVILYGYIFNAFLITLFREVVKDKEDAQYDKKAGTYTVGSLSDQKFRWILNGIITINFIANGIWFYHLRQVLRDQNWKLGLLFIFIPLGLITLIFNLSHRQNVYVFLSKLTKIYILFALLLLILWQRT